MAAAAPACEVGRDMCAVVTQSRGQAVGDRPRPPYSLSRAPLEAAALLGDLVTPSISSALRYPSPITRPAPWSLSI